MRPAAVTIAIGAALGCGLLLSVSPLLWPAGARPVRRRQADRLRTRLAAAGLDGVSPAAFLAVSGVLGLAVGALAEAGLGVLPLALVAGGVAVLLPYLLLGARERGRARERRTVWPDVVDQLVSAVRAGLALPDAVAALARTGPERLRPAFEAFERDYRSTGNFALSTQRLKARLADPVADRILETLRMAREVGGSDLTAVLHALGSYLREEGAIRNEVEARQGWVTGAGRLGVAAPWIVLVVLASRPEARAAYNTQAGLLVIGIGLVVSVIAYRVMLALGRLPRERRWLQ